MKWLDRLVPAVCDVSVTNVCNAACDFCSYARDKDVVRERRWIDRTALARALPILYGRGIRYLAFQGGEPLLHPDIVAMVRDVRAIGIRPALITNGWLLPQYIEPLVASGLGTLLVSIDSHSMTTHEANRGLRGLGERIRVGLRHAGEHRMMRLACVTVNRLVDYDRLPDLLRWLGFDAVTFSYPRREPLGSSSLVYSEKSELVAFERDELLRALDAIAAMKERFPVLNPAASIADIKRHVRGEPERFPCVGGHKYFYLDWNLDIWRCEAWSKPLGSVFDLERVEDQRERCTACMMTCYRDTSVLMHAGVAVAGAVTTMASGHLLKAAGMLFRRSVAESLLSLAAERATVARLR
jgi:MoaA/NifB/PqqE/SkfB family radical SAM enzyme